MFSFTLISSSLFFPPAAKKNQSGAAALSRALFALDISEHRAKLSGPLAGKAAKKNLPISAQIFPRIIPYYGCVGQIGMVIY